jgi:hypothetical protein
MARNPKRLGLTRDQFASFLNDFEQIKQFENLFASVDEMSNFSIDEVSIAADNAGAAANEAQAGVDRLQDDVSLTSLAPVIQNNTSESTDYIDFHTTAPAPVSKQGRFSWNSGDGTLNIGMGYDAVVQHIGLDQYYRIKASAAITKGQCVMFDGAVGSSGVLKGKPSTGVTNPQYIMGVAAMDIANNGFGYIASFGIVRGINTTGSSVGETWADGDVLFYNPAYVGGLTKVEPIAPLPKVVVAAVVNAGSGGSGSLFIRVQAEPYLQGLTDVYAPSPISNGQILIGDGPQSRWEAATLTAGTNVSITNAAGAITINASDAFTGTVTSVSVTSANGFAGTVANPTTTPAITLSTTVTGLVKGNGTALSAASAGTDYVAPGAITTSGLTMSTGRLLGRTTASSGAVEEITVGTGLSLTAGTLSNSAPDQTVVLTAGTGISVSGTYPSFTITNTAPDQIVSLTGAGTTVVTGTYPSFTITSNDQYVGTVTSVSGTGTVNGITLTGSVTSSGSLTLGGTLGGIANSQLSNSSITINGSAISLGGSVSVGTVTSVGGTGSVNGITLTGSVTSTGNLTLGGTLSNVSLTTQVTGTLPVGNGGTGTSTTFTSGSIIFAGASGVYSQDNANLNWDDTNNTLGVGRTAASNVRVYSKGGTTGGGAFSYYGENSAGTGCFGIRDDGAFYSGQASLSPYNLTTAAAANLVVAADYYLYRSTSSARYKKNIVDYDRGLAAVRKLRAVYYEGKGEIDEGQRFAGFVAEEVYDSGLTEFVVLDKEGKPDALHYGNMAALFASAIDEIALKLERIEAALGIEDGDNS